MSTKFCKICNNILPLDMFPKDKKMIGGYTNNCKKCLNESRREKNKEKKIKGTYKIPDRKEYIKKYYELNKEQLKKASNEYYSNHKEDRKEYQKNRRIIKKDYYKDYSKKYRITNIQKLQQYKRDRYKNDISFRIKHLLRSRFLETVKNNYKTESVLEMIGCSVEEFKNYIEKLWQPGMTWENHGFGDNKWHLDHIIPCDFFDLTNKENQLKCFHHTNFQPLWQKDNLSKGNKYDSARLS